VIPLLFEETDLGKKVLNVSHQRAQNINRDTDFKIFTIHPLHKFNIVSPDLFPQAMNGRERWREIERYRPTDRIKEWECIRDIFWCS